MHHHHRRASIVHLDEPQEAEKADPRLLHELLLIIYEIPPVGITDYLP